MILITWKRCIYRYYTSVCVCVCVCGWTLTDRQTVESQSPPQKSIWQCTHYTYLGKRVLLSESRDWSLLLTSKNSSPRLQKRGCVAFNNDLQSSSEAADLHWSPLPSLAFRSWSARLLCPSRSATLLATTAPHHSPSCSCSRRTRDVKVATH